jgi:uncharacterized protein DUF4112
VRIPGTNIRFGLDALVGLVPGIGDIAGAVFAGYVIMLGSQMGVSRTVITRMLTNVAIDTLVGSAPVLGDIFDVAWKSNMRNVSLLEESVGHVAARPVNRMLVVVVIVALALLVVGAVAVAFFVVKALLHAF